MSTIKVVFNEEVRRVQVAGAISAASYMKLEERIRSLFPALKDSRFTLVWQDDEGDKVSISSGSEFFEALQVMSFSHGVPRFIVKPVVGKASASTVHSSVTCDECGVSPIQGARFKCTVRNDFDLCEGCENRHSQPYPMIKITASDPLSRLSPFGARGTHRSQGRECVRGLPPQFQQIAGNPLVGHFGEPVRISLSPPIERTACHPLFAAFGCPSTYKSAPSPSNNNKDAEEVKQLDSEVISFLQAIGAIPRGETASQPAPANKTTSPKSPAVATDVEKTSAADRLESELTDILQAIFSGQHVTKNNIGSNVNTAHNTSSSANISSSNNSSSASTESSSSTQQQQGVTRDLNDEDEALQTAIRESLRVESAQEGEQKQLQNEEEEDVEDVWSESESVSSTDFQVVNNSTSTPPVITSESVVVTPESVVVSVGPTEEELLLQWKHELALLASMGFVDARGLLPLLQTHVGSSTVSSSSSVATNEHRAEGLQRVVGELLRGKF